MREIKYTWRVRADDDTQALLKMRMLTMLGDKLGTKDMEALAKSTCLPYFVECAQLESQGKEVVPPLSKKEESLILFRRKVLQVIRKLLFLNNRKAQITSL